MKSPRNVQPVFLLLSKALSDAKVSSQTTEGFARKLTASILGKSDGRSTLVPHPSTQVAVASESEIVVPPPLPNEILQGWRGRVSVLNSLKTDAEVEAALLDVAAKKPQTVGDDPDFVDCAAAALGTPRQELIRRNTLTPFFDALNNLKQNKPGQPSYQQRTYQKRAPLRLDGKHALFCPQCAAEDVAFWGFSYWRRSHQLPGAFCCSTHGEALVIAGDRKCFDHCPDNFLNDHMQTCAQPDDGPAGVILSRYARIAEDILDNASTIESSAASSLLGALAKAAELSTSKQRVRKTVSTYLMDLLPLTWLEDTLPRVTWQRDKYISTIDGACTPNTTRYTAATLCLLAAVFYSDADQAIAELVNHEGARREPNLGFDFWSSREMFELYCANDGVASRVAEAIGQPASSVTLGLLNQGLPGLGKSTAIRRALRAYFAGKPIEEACQMEGVSKAQLEGIVRASGSRLAKALEWMADREFGMQTLHPNNAEDPK
jgi:hypothetical protein